MTCIWNIKSRKHLVTLYSLDAGEDWLIMTPEGYFTGSEGAIRHLQWRVEEQLYPAKRFRKRFERPDLVRQALAGKESA